MSLLNVFRRTPGTVSGSLTIVTRQGNPIDIYFGKERRGLAVEDALRQIVDILTPVANAPAVRDVGPVLENSQ